MSAFVKPTFTKYKLISGNSLHNFVLCFVEEFRQMQKKMAELAAKMAAKKAKQKPSTSSTQQQQLSAAAAAATEESGPCQRKKTVPTTGYKLASGANKAAPKAPSFDKQVALCLIYLFMHVYVRNRLSFLMGD